MFQIKVHFISEDVHAWKFHFVSEDEYIFLLHSIFAIHIMQEDKLHILCLLFRSVAYDVYITFIINTVHYFCMYYTYLYNNYNAYGVCYFVGISILFM